MALYFFKGQNVSKTSDKPQFRNLCYTLIHANLDYVVNSALKKIFDTNSKEIILECRLMFDLNSIGDILLKRQSNFLLAYMSFTCCFAAN